jgi:hypothetical protein
MRREKYQRIEGAFSYVLKETLKEPAWRALSHGARSLYVHLKANYIQHVGNAVYLSAREAAKELGGSKNRIGTWFDELEHYGFIVQIMPAYLGVEGKGKAAHWRLTEVHYLGQPATKDYRNWNGERFHKQKPPSHYKRKNRLQFKKQKPVPTVGDTVSPPSGTPLSPPSGTGRPEPVPTVRDIKTTPDCPHRQGHNLVAIPIPLTAEPEPAAKLDPAEQQIIEAKKQRQASQARYDRERS